MKCSALRAPRSTHESRKSVRSNAGLSSLRPFAAVPIRRRESRPVFARGVPALPDRPSTSSAPDASARNNRRRILPGSTAQGPERFSLFNACVQDVLHFSAARIDYDRSIAERARPELHPPLEPPDNQTAGDIARGAPCRFLISQGFVFQAAAIEFRADLAVAKLRSGVRSLHHFNARLSQQLIPNLITDSQRCAAVARRGLHKHPLKGSVEQNLSVHH